MIHQFVVAAENFDLVSVRVKLSGNDAFSIDILEFVEFEAGLLFDFLVVGYYFFDDCFG